MTEQQFIERYTYDAATDLLGEGGFGKVYRAYDNYEHEYVAIKMQDVNPQHPELRLRNEFDKVQQHVHRYIARYKDCYTLKSYRGETDIAIMKYYEAGGLDKLMISGKLSREMCFTMLENILEGIAFLHSNGIIHRDLKPQNILIVEHTGKYAPLITDFGISKQLAEGESSAVSNSVLGGTRAYASPEQLKEATIRKNTDLWSFGVIAYQMLAGELPFNSGTFSPTSEEGRQEQFRQMMSGVLPEKLRSIPEPWQRLIRECLVVDATKRLAHAEDCLDMVNGSATYSSNSTIVYNDRQLNSDPSAETIVNVPNIIHHTPKKSYNVGDYYNENGKEGIVFEVWDNGCHGKIISIDESHLAWCTSIQYNKNIETGASSETDGWTNTYKIHSNYDIHKYPAFCWCNDKGRDWYLPTSGEMYSIYKVLRLINNTLLQNRYSAISGYYWLSTECSAYTAMYIHINSGILDSDSKYYSFRVRAVATF